jgi:DNA-binding transcriptional ArsR family regulator
MRRPSELARLAGLIADPSRAVMLDALMDGTSRSIGELARDAHVSLSTASEHVAALAAGGLVVAEPDGRRRLVRLRDAQVAQALESLANLPSASQSSGTPGGLRAARTCYDHLAGRLGVGLADALVERGHLLRVEDGFAVTDGGGDWFGSIGIDVGAVAAGRRAFARACLDWTERRPHLAGALGAALARQAFERGWIVRSIGSRGVLLTPRGRATLVEVLGPGIAWSDRNGDERRPRMVARPGS